jgi:hypothetical protein
MRHVIRMYLTWQRLEIALVALLVPGLIVESSVANGWVYGGGTLTVISFLRGFFFEVVTYVTARQAFVLARKKQVLSCLVMALVSLAAVYVSAVNNLGWVMAGHDLGGFFGTLGRVMGNGPLVRGYEFFLAVLLPLSVGAIALVPLDHFFQHALEQDHLDNHAVLVDERHMHRTRYLKAQRKQKKRIQQAYEAIAEDRANQFIDQARDGDFSFGVGITPIPSTQPQALLPAPSQSQGTSTGTGTGRVWPANTGIP